MKVNSYNRDISFNGVLNNNILKKTLEFAAENGTLFAATTTLALSSTARPLAILSTPKTDKKNKQVACSKAITSTVTGYLIALVSSIPLSHSIRKIDKNPQKYLKKETISNLKEAKKELTESKAYSMATQLFKLGLGFLIAAPKSILTAIGTPYILNIFDKNEKSEQNQIVQNNPTFKGKDKLTTGVSKLIDLKPLQDFVKKHKDSNFPMHIIAATDTLATATFIKQISTSDKLEKKDKIPLIYNSAISTGLSIASTYFIDSLTKKPTEKLIRKYKEINEKDPNLSKQIEGLKIAKPILIAGIVYYIFIPIIATFTADRIPFQNNKQ